MDDTESAQDGIITPQLASAIEEYLHSETSGTGHLKTLGVNIDHAIDICKNTIRALLLRRNECALTSRLPDEVLEEIFWQATDGETGSIGCIYPSQVCRRWRAVALGSPILWSYIVANGCTNEAVLNMLFERAGSIPLVVRLSDQFPANFAGRSRQETDAVERQDKDERVCAIFALVLAQLPRMRPFTIHARDDVSASSLLDIYPVLPAPRLQTLFLTLGKRASRLTSNLFSGDMPVLRRVASTCHSIYHLLPLMRPTVTWLAVRTSTTRLLNHAMMTAANFFSALGGMQMLETLILEEELFEDELTPTTTLHYSQLTLNEFPLGTTPRWDHSYIALDWPDEGELRLAGGLDAVFSTAGADIVKETVREWQGGRKQPSKLALNRCYGITEEVAAFGRELAVREFEVKGLNPDNEQE